MNINRRDEIPVEDIGGYVIKKLVITPPGLYPGDAHGILTHNNEVIDYSIKFLNYPTDKIVV